MRGILFIFLLTITHVISLRLNPALNPKKGFSLRMIHIDSKESPLYPGDHLTREERFQRFVKQSKAQARNIESQILVHYNGTRSVNPNAARLPLVYELSRSYIAMVGLGTFPNRRQPFMNYYLVVDTGSDQTWLQCEGSIDKFYQDMPLYPWSLSTTFRILPCNTHPLCAEEDNNCNPEGDCTYESEYANGAFTSGVVAEEKFTLGSDTGGLESIQLHFGCGLYQEFEGIFGDNHNHGKRDLIAGILGLGSGQWSFLNQLGDIGQGKFVYCLETYNDQIEGSNTYLRFGADATIGGVGQEVRTTPIVVPEFQTSIYYLNLEDISVGNRKAGFPKGTFKLDGQRDGGCIIDSGSQLSHMYKDHFDIVANMVKAHFDDLGVDYIGPQYDFDICFRLPRSFDTSKYPSITLHFQQADYVISDYKANFWMTSETACLAIFRQDTNYPAFLLGAMQQTNKRILFDVMGRSLSFATENCYWGS